MSVEINNCAAPQDRSTRLLPKAKQSAKARHPKAALLDAEEVTELVEARQKVSKKERIMFPEHSKMMTGRVLHSFCCVLAMATTTVAQKQFRLADTEAGVRLPKAMSDVSAVVGPDDLIYIAGGCDSPFGSQYNEEAESFRCNSVSDSFYAFDPETNEFAVLPVMPTPRYRHAAVSINNQIWIVGGRDANDDLVGTVHVS